MKKDILPERGIEGLINHWKANGSKHIEREKDFRELLKSFFDKSLSPVGEVTEEEIEAEALKRYPETTYFDDEHDCYIDYNSRLRHGFVTGQKLMRDRLRSQALSSTEKEDAGNHMKILLENRDAYISQLEKNNEALITYAKNIREARFASSTILDEQVKIEHLISTQ